MAGRHVDQAFEGMSPTTLLTIFSPSEPIPRARLQGGAAATAAMDDTGDDDSPSTVSTTKLPFLHPIARCDPVGEYLAQEAPVNRLSTPPPPFPSSKEVFAETMDMLDALAFSCCCADDDSCVVVAAATVPPSLFTLVFVGDGENGGAAAFEVGCR